MKKQCTKCKLEKNVSKFFKDKRNKSGLYSACKTCHYEYIKKNKKVYESQKEWQAKNKEYFIQWRKNNPDKIRKYKKRWKKKYSERVKEYQRKYKEKYPEKILELARQWRKNNKEKMRAYDNKWRKNNLKFKLHLRRKMKIRRKIDPKFRLDHNIANLLGVCLKGKKAGQKWEKLVGYPIEDLMKHLESQFDNKMNWENYGSYWWVDHIKPRSLFKYESPEDKEFKECWALKNLQPLEKIANIKKSNHIS